MRRPRLPHTVMLDCFTRSAVKILLCPLRSDAMPLEPVSGDAPLCHSGRFPRRYMAEIQLITDLRNHGELCYLRLIARSSVCVLLPGFFSHGIHPLHNVPSLTLVTLQP